VIYAVKVPVAADVDVEQLVRDGWQQVSRKFCTIARLPPGLTGRQALATRDVEMASRVDKHGHFIHSESDCAGFYLRVFGHADGNWMELRLDDFKRFRKLGGQAAR
jgi:hypothetical protein